MKAINFLKFETNPPTLKLPPKGEVVAYYDTETGRIVAKDSEGSLVTFDGDGIASGDLVPGAGEIGETRQALRYLGDSALTLTTEVGANIASIQLTPGDWDVEGVVSFLSASADPGFCYASISTVSGNVTFNGQEGYAVATGTNYASAPVTRRIIQTATTITVYLVANAVFDTGAMEAGGSITARRVRRFV